MVSAFLLLLQTIHPRGGLTSGQGQLSVLCSLSLWCPCAGSVAGPQRQSGVHRSTCTQEDGQQREGRSPGSGTRRRVTGLGSDGIHTRGCWNRYCHGGEGEGYYTLPAEQDSTKPEKMPRAESHFHVWFRGGNKLLHLPLKDAAAVQVGCNPGIIWCVDFNTSATSLCWQRVGGKNENNVFKRLIKGSISCILCSTCWMLF